MPTSSPTPPFSIVSASLDDFEVLAELRIAAMRESLERVGRFDPARARERLRSTFQPAHTHLVLVEGNNAGFYAMRPTDVGLQLDHLYIHPRFQNRGLGSAILRQLCAVADERGCTMLVDALKASASNRFYQRHGFTLAEVSEWDNYYRRLPAATRA